MPDLSLLKELCLLSGVSGREEAVRNRILKEIQPYVDEWRIDGLGNLIVFKKGKQRPKVNVMLSAHMDEVGFIVTHVTAEGYLKFATVGGIDQRVIAGRSVMVGSKQIPGVIGMKPIHLSNSDEREKAVSLDRLYIDIGAKDREEALEYIQLGDEVCFEPFFEVSDGCVKAKALDDRAGCMVLISLLRQDLAYDVTAAFVVQEEVGLRGSAAAAYSIHPDAAIVVESTTAADICGVEEEKRVCCVGKGAVLSFMDRRTIYDKEYYQYAFEIARSQNIPCQVKQAVAGGNDAGAIHVSRGGVRTLAVSLPCRYLHSAVSLVSQKDLDSVEKIVSFLLEGISRGICSKQEVNL